MKKITFLILLFTCTAVSFAQDELKGVKESSPELNHNQVVGNNEKETILALAEERATVIQKELNLTNYTSKIVQKAIVHYSVKANKIIQSNLPVNEKTKSLSNLVYFQNEELKEVLTVSQFYQYLKLRNNALN